MRYSDTFPFPGDAHFRSGLILNKHTHLKSAVNIKLPCSTVGKEECPVGCQNFCSRQNTLPSPIRTGIILQQAKWKKNIFVLSSLFCSLLSPISYLQNDSSSLYTLLPAISVGCCNAQFSPGLYPAFSFSFSSFACLIYILSYVGGFSIFTADLSRNRVKGNPSSLVCSNSRSLSY